MKKTHLWKPGTMRSYCGLAGAADIVSRPSEATCRKCIRAWDRHERQPAVRRWNGR